MENGVFRGERVLADRQEFVSGRNVGGVLMMMFITALYVQYAFFWGNLVFNGFLCFFLWRMSVFVGWRRKLGKEIRRKEIMMKSNNNDKEEDGEDYEILF